jgi:hypothetical protein
LLPSKAGKVRIEEITISVKDTNQAGTTVANEIVFLHQLMGFLIPVFSFIVFYLVSRRLWLGIACSFAYMIDIPSVSYQTVILTETSSIFFFWLSCVGASIFFRYPRWYSALIFGILSALVILVRPGFLILYFSLILALGSWLLLRWRIKGIIMKMYHVKTIFVLFIAMSLPPFFWSLYNYINHGYFIFSAGSSYTLPNITARLFTRINVNKKELQVLRKHFAQTMNPAVNEGEWWAQYKVQAKVREELGINEVEYLRLLKKASFLAIRTYPQEYLRDLESRFFYVWEKPYSEFRPTELTDKARLLPFFRRIFAIDGQFIIKRNRILWFIILCLMASTALNKVDQRVSITYLGSTVFLNIVMCAAVDAAEVQRHALGTESLLIAIFIFTICVLSSRIIQLLLSSDKNRARSGISMVDTNQG